MKKLNVVYFGTPDFSVPCLDVLANHPMVNLVKVISMPDRPKGRGHQLQSPPVVDYCKENKIPYFQTENINKEDDFKEELKGLDIDVMVVLAFAQFLRQDVLDIPKQGCFNIHTSLLPRFRGAAPIQYALMEGDKTTGVSIQRMVKKMDAGDVCLSHELPVREYETGGLLYTRLKYQAAVSLTDFIEDLLQGTLKFEVQDESKVTIAPTLKREDGAINFIDHTAKEIERKVRSLIPWPGSYCYLGKKRLKVFSVEFDQAKLSAGEVSTKFGTLIVGTKEGSLRISELQLEGKKRCSDEVFLNGFKDEVILK